MHEKLMGERLERQKEFFSLRKPGGILAYYNFPSISRLLVDPRGNRSKWGKETLAYLGSFFVDQLQTRSVEELCNNEDIRRITCDFLRLFEEISEECYQIDNDYIPTISVSFGIGSITAAMSGRKAKFLSGTSWCSPLVDWEDIAKLSFNSQNIWVQFHLKVYKTLLQYCNGKFLMVPFLHRSPLDAANGLRGDALFYDFYDHPEKVKWLVNWSAEWSIELEKYISENVKGLEPCGRGIWGTYLPDGAIFVNGDPVDMIRREFLPIFDKPYTEKLFQAIGGGFFHHHTLGLHQVDQLASTKGMLIQEIWEDPNTPSIPEVMITDKKMRNKILEASLKTPIQLEDFSLGLIDQLLPIIKDGRFILSPLTEGKDNAKQFIKKVRKFSNIA